jgi:hypothetical protein
VVPFDLNLIREEVPPPARRRMTLGLMLAYLVFSSGVLVVVVYGSTRKLVAAHKDRVDIARLDMNFREECPGTGDILSAAKQLGERATRRVETLNLLEDTLSRRMDLPRLMAGIVGALPRTATLHRVVLDKENGMVRFEVAVPADAASPLTIDVRQFVAAWGRDSYLAMELGKIRPVASHHRQIQGEEVLVMEFAGTLRRQEA